MPKITYSQHGDYLLPNIVLRDSLSEQVEPLTKYGIMRKSYLKNHRSLLYNRLLLAEKLYPHCREVQHTAEDRFEMLMAQLVEYNPPPDKVLDGLGWAAHMNTLKRIANETILTELIYV